MKYEHGVWSFKVDGVAVTFIVLSQAIAQYFKVYAPEQYQSRSENI